MNNNHKIHFVGNAHLDPVWLWRWQEGYAEIKATFRSALDRMNEFPDFIFTCGCAAYYQWIEENALDMFKEIQERVREGRWVIVGGQWIQPDCNIPSGESFARHSLYSQRYFLNKFGLMAKVGYNVDSFGHNGMLPQILKKSGMDYYVFQRPDNNEKDLPGYLFWWESEDGSRVMTYKIPLGYATFDDWYPELKVERKLKAVMDLSDATGMDAMYFYGVGNHGGGPTITTLNLIKKLRQEISEESLVMSSPDTFFSEMSKQNLSLPVVHDDLQHHASGCYSVGSEIKANNRKAEHRLLITEKFSTIAHHLFKVAYPGEKLNKAWENVMFNQFHDIMGGCSIKEAYVDAVEFYGEALNSGARLLNSAIQTLSWSIDTMDNDIFSISKEKDWLLWEIGDRGVPLVVFNSLSWEINIPIQVNKILKGITDEDRTPVEIQTVRGGMLDHRNKHDTLFMGKIPPMGYRVYWIYGSKEFEIQEKSTVMADENGILENNFVKLVIEKHTGYIKSFYDKVRGVEILSGNGAVPIVIDDFHNDTWAHGCFEFAKEIGKFTDARITVIENGSLRARLRVTTRFNDSRLQQDFILYKDRPDIEVRVKLNWNETHKILKLSFPVNINEPRATYEIPYGYMERHVNGEEEPGQQWIDVTGTLSDKDDQEYGLTLINDSKYSFSIKDKDMRMTLVRSSIFADHYGHRDDDDNEFIDQGIQEFKYMLVPHSGNWREGKISKKAYEFNTTPIQVIETYHKGVNPLVMSGITLDADNIIITVFKKAEEGEGYILRGYETTGIETEVTIEMPILNRKWQTKFKKCEIKTFFIPENIKEEVIEKNLLEM